MVIATNHSHVDYENLVKRAELVVDTRNATKEIRRSYRDKIVVFVGNCRRARRGPFADRTQFSQRFSEGGI